MKSQLHLLPNKDKPSKEDVLSAQSEGPLLACDFKIVGVEGWDEKPWGYQSGRITNIDHHAEAPAMRRNISSANLALIYVHENGQAKSDESVVINHTDCDSVLSAAIVGGDLEPLEIFGQAAIAADHTGDENAIADLLQALNPLRDYEYSLAQLQLLLSGTALDKQAQSAMELRLHDRDRAAQLVRDGAFQVQNGVAWAALDSRIDGEFLPALLPQAQLIVLFYPHHTLPDTWNNKVRLGNAASEGYSMFEFIQPFDKKFGGRWNAGSNKRGEGSKLTPTEYIAELMKNVTRQGD